MVYKQRGDTLIEVLMAVAVLSLVIVGSITLMTRGLEAAQSALEHSEARASVNSQLEMLRYLRDQYSTNKASADAATWLAIVGGSNVNPTDYASGCNVTPAKSGTAFYLDKSTGPVQDVPFDATKQPTTFATPGKGMWIEATPSNAISPAYIDFVVRACWQALGGGAMQQTVTAERLYDPSR